MRITKKVFNDLALFMIGFGLLIGIIFPFFVRLIGIPAEYISLTFVLMCLLAGLLVGGFNIFLARAVVAKRMKRLSERMKYVIKSLENPKEIEPEKCLETCIIPVDSEDVIGETSQSFNDLVSVFLATLKSEQSMRNFTEIFTNELDLEKLSDKALNHLLKYTQASAGMILIDKGGSIDISSTYLIKHPESIKELDIIHQSFSRGKRMLFEFSEAVTIETGLIDFRPETVLLEPINYKGDVLGIILLASTKTFETSVLDTLEIYVHGLSLGMHNAITHDKLEQIAILDPLTKIFNRRFGMERLKEEYAHSIKASTPLGLMMLDIDHFKKINDTYGHIVGDQFLINISKILRQNLRKGDVLIRYGGEEFLAILPGASAVEVEKIGEQIRRFTEENVMTYQQQAIKATISIGGSSYPELEINNVEDLVKKADANLYKSKQTGRNKVTVST